MRRDEEQAFPRVKRICQKRETHTYRFTNAQSVTEDRIIEKQKNRARFNNQSLRKAGGPADFGDEEDNNHALFDGRFQDLSNEEIIDLEAQAVDVMIISDDEEMIELALEADIMDISDDEEIVELEAEATDNMVIVIDD